MTAFRCRFIQSRTLSHHSASGARSMGEAMREVCHYQPIALKGPRQRTLTITGSVILTAAFLSLNASAAPIWSGFAGDAQHTANSAIPSQALGAIHWQTPV